ncbi:putative methyltransferase [Candidatus Magnetominusculus xianensis]|uniref:site-specific DNA-methyltransferase (cytosine-N(4)-specific) n=2 Tax=Candidatus Magnetominusculus xianensis TaxID=1748249 RepID=A0ABR5SHU7_9BACT|nr:putative methyltransferase [Candidatus Magnetominusculus xianensis]
MSLEWHGSAYASESTLHQISPYIGKMKTSMSKALITTFTNKNDTIYDPFSGSGNVALESWIAGRNVIACDLNPYAALITKAKLFPALSIEELLIKISNIDYFVNSTLHEIDLQEIPEWVRAFFNPKTLIEIIAWVKVLKRNRDIFLLSCLLGILHHQRPGFLSYPSSHAVPYLRDKKFPQNEYPEMYEYRPVRERIEKKVMRTLKRVPFLDVKLKRKCYQKDAVKFSPKEMVNAIITSPPYMKQLDYGRDNRLRLWFLGINDWKSLNTKISPSEKQFIILCRNCLERWKSVLVHNGLCILVIGDTFSSTYKMSLHELLIHIAVNEVKGYSLEWKHTESIPNIRRVRRNCVGSNTETIIVLRKK